MSGRALLIVGADVRRRETYVSALAAAGWTRLLRAAGLAEAVGFIRTGLASLAGVVVDAQLSDVTGLQAVPVLASLLPHCRIVFTSAANTQELEEQVQALGVFYYYIDSTDRSELVAAVNDAVGAPLTPVPGTAGGVLVVDDDPGFHVFTRTILQSAGFRVLSAYGEREGLELARREHPAVILLDIVMQSTTDGFEFCHEARRDPQLRHTPIIGISALKDWLDLHYPADRDPSLFPVDGFLRKPISAEQLLAEMRRFLPQTA